MKSIARIVSLLTVAVLTLAIAPAADDLDAFIQAQMAQRQVNGLSIAIMRLAGGFTTFCMALSWTTLGQQMKAFRLAETESRMKCGHASGAAETSSSARVASIQVADARYLSICACSSSRVNR